MMASTSDNGLVLSGYQKKLKTMKKKFFVLYKETTDKAARLEYYDTEKKFLQKTDPKRIIYLKSCFNINRRIDTKHKFVLALSSREGGFGIVLNSENELRKWLDNLLSIQRDNANRSDQVYTPYEHVWQVIVQRKGMSENAGITGSYHCCLTSKSLTFICIGPEKLPNGEDRILKVEVLLTTIRRCGHASPQSIFYMELGRQSVLGSGELWMETEDATIAKNMHDMILNAMSAKTESNMNLLNVYKGKSELSNEPMRKRSSSATEASKPINVLQKRHNTIETRNSFSPQYNSYGRERCDSLPTRNRTLSECSTQTYIALKHGHRCNTISGSRPYTTQHTRHSDSPPITTPMKCSESEESSISIDEADDKAMIDAYRINSRTSKGVILEENIDDLNVSDNSKLSGINGSFPLQGSNTILSVADEHLNYDFPEHSSEKLGKDSDVDTQCERPTRAYSIGNKVEHTKMNKLLKNLNEVDNSSTRVRAYSVGSKSKIPRCDIQRGVLFSKAKKGLADINQCTEVVGFNTPRAIKSTSAPLLNLRHYINTDRMSDLMEIDFSNVSTPSTSSQEQKSFQNIQMSNPSNPHLSSNGNIICNTLKNDLQRQDESPNKHSITKCVESSDNGYLEMKPVGKAPLNSKQTSLEDQLKKLRLQNTLLSPQDEPMDSCNSSTLVSEKSSIQSLSPVKPIRRFTEDRKVEPRPDTSTDLAKTTNLNNTEKLNSSQHKTDKTDENTKLENNKIENTILNIALDISSAAAVGRKLIHSISNEDYTKHVNKPYDAADTKEVGYQILQIKSDSSLISKKKNQRPIYKPHQCGRQLLEGVNSPVLETNKSPKSKLISTNLKDSATDGPLNKDDKESSASGSCEHELYYASLDLPQCSGQITPKCLKSATCESPPVAVSFENRNSYAKIDFDQSDSSSASSKIFNV
ncbi:insulin receptor substrate 1 isoform X2 [Drosophila innubila]|uniref:insulin receptor substrate 1 isoform X2 n=1 Tax=Drosophila innubila TaxID=198719 RepID=UPI00148CE603|nr:insulin receptor substrate 1 isoform X2 [Drosophila innubila]